MQEAMQARYDELKNKQIQLGKEIKVRPFLYQLK